MVTKVMDRVNAFLATIAAFILVFITLIITYAIVCRLIGVRGPIWVNQFSEYGLLFVTFLGTAWLLSIERHTAVTIVTDALPPKARAVAKQLHMIVGAALSGILFWFTFRTAWDHHMRGVIDVNTVDIPKAWILGVIPFGFLLLTIQFLLLLHKYWVALQDMKRPGGPPPESLAAAMMAHRRGKGEE